MGMAGGVLSLVGAGVSAVSTIGGTMMSMNAAREEGIAAQQAAAYRAAVARNEAALMRWNANLARADAARAGEEAGRAGEAGQRQAYQQDLNARQIIGETIAEQGASGLSGGSHAAVQNTLRVLAAQDRQNVANSTQATIMSIQDQQRAHEIEAVNFDNQAQASMTASRVELASGDLARRAATSRMRSALWSGAGQLGGTIIGAASSPLVENWFRRRGTRGTFSHPFGMTVDNSRAYSF